MELHERLKNARETLNISQEEMANIVGLSQTAVSQIENGVRKKANVKYIDELIINHNISYEWIVHGTGTMRKENTNTDNVQFKTKVKEKTNKEQIFESREATEILGKILKQQEENSKQLDKLLTSLSSAYNTIELLTKKLVSSDNLEKLKAYTMQPVGYQNSTAVYAHS
jgi:transcriptional regulator with XRE-family HTH domain